MSDSTELYIKIGKSVIDDLHVSEDILTILNTNPIVYASIIAATDGIFKLDDIIDDYYGSFILDIDNSLMFIRPLQLYELPSGNFIKVTINSSLRFSGNPEALLQIQSILMSTGSDYEYCNNTVFVKRTFTCGDKTICINDVNLTKVQFVSYLGIVLKNN